jgi:hypothetical protein
MSTEDNMNVHAAQRSALPLAPIIALLLTPAAVAGPISAGTYTLVGTSLARPSRLGAQSLQASNDLKTSSIEPRIHGIKEDFMGVALCVPLLVLESSSVDFRRCDLATQASRRQ